jgi:predicted small lipoprotein YifL
MGLTAALEQLSLKRTHMTRIESYLAHECMQDTLLIPGRKGALYLPKSEAADVYDRYAPESAGQAGGHR